MTMHIAKTIGEVRIQIEYTICTYIATSVTQKDNKYVIVDSLTDFLEAVSSDRVDKIKEDYEADEVFVSGMVVISQEQENEVFTHFDGEKQVTSMNIQVDNDDMNKNLERSLQMIDEQTREFYQNIQETIKLYKI